MHSVTGPPQSQPEPDGPVPRLTLKADRRGRKEPVQSRDTQEGKRKHNSINGFTNYNRYSRTGKQNPITLQSLRKGRQPPPPGPEVDAVKAKQSGRSVTVPKKRNMTL